MNTPLFDSTVRHMVHLEGLKKHEVNKIAAFLKELDRSLRGRLSSEDLTVFSRRRLEKLLTETDATLASIFNEYYDELSGHLLDIGEFEASFEAQNLEQALKGIDVNYTSAIPSAKQLKAAIFSQPLSVRDANGGKLLEPFIQDWKRDERRRLVGAIRMGVFEGQTTGDIIKNIRGTPENKFRDGLLATTQRHAESIVRTAIQHVSTVARTETLKENRGVVKGFRWVSTLDGRTTPMCRSMDGKVNDLDEGPKPPGHVNCRSSIIAELQSRYQKYMKGSKRESKDGPVSGGLTYYEWLKTQPEEFQDDVLGKKRGRLFRDGGLSAKRFAELNLNRNFKEVSLEIIKKKTPSAFERAGL